MSRKFQSENDRRAYLTETPVNKLIPTLAVPTIISMLVTGIYNSADTYFVGRISTEATAAVGLVFSVMAIIQALAFFCGQGSGNYISRLLGAKDEKKAGEIAATGFAMAIVLGILLAVFGNIFASEIADIIGAVSSSRNDTIDYLRIILMGAPFTMGQFLINNQLRFQGSAFYAMTGLMAGAVINIGLDPLLIFVFNMGIKGAAAATVAGQAISFAALYIGSLRGQNVRIKLRNIRPTFSNIISISNGGLPSLVRQGLAAAATLLMNRAAGAFAGDSGIAGMSIVTRVTMLMFSALIGFGQGYQPVCSYNYGAKLYSRVKEGFYFCVKYGTVFLAVASVGCFIFARPIVACFRDDADVIAIGAKALRWQSAAMPFNALAVLVNMMLQASGQGIKSSITSSARNGIFFIPLILLLPRLLGIDGVAMTQAVADVLTFVLCIFFVRREFRLYEKLEKKRDAETPAAEKQSE